MTTPASSDLVREPGGDTLTLAIAKARARIKALKSAQLVRPEQFNAVANSSASGVATANKTALQNWLNAGKDGGILYADPNDTYDVVVTPIGGTNAGDPLRVLYPVILPFLRLRTRQVATGTDYRLLQFDFVASAVMGLVPAAITRGQRSWVLSDAPTVPLIPGTEIMLSDGQDAYSDDTNGLYLRARVSQFDPSSNTLVLDRPAPRSFGRVTSGPPPTLSVIANSASGSVIGAIEIDQSTQDANRALTNPLVFRGVHNIDIEGYAVRRTTSNGMRFEMGASRIGMGYYESTVSAAQSSVGSGAITLSHSSEIKIKRVRQAHPSATRLVRCSRYSQGLDIDSMECFVSGTDWTSFDLAVLYAEQESEAASVAQINIVTDIDASGAGEGVVLAKSVTGAKEFQVGQARSNKDFYSLGCRPTFLETKTIRGARTQFNRVIDLPANPSTVGTASTDFWLGSVYVDEFRFKYSHDLEADRQASTSFGLSLFTDTFDGAGVQTDSLLYQYGKAAQAANATAPPPDTWYDWQLPLRDVSNVANSSFYNFCLSSVDRMLRYTAPVSFPARSITLSYAGYPVKNLFVRDLT